MSLINVSNKAVEEKAALNRLKQELTHWRETRSCPGAVPDELRKKVVALHHAGVPLGRFKSVGLGHSQIHNWLSTLSEAEPAQENRMTFAQVLEKKAVPSNQSAVSAPIHLSVKQGQLELSVTCTDIDVASQLLKTALADSNAATHPSS